MECLEACQLLDNTHAPPLSGTQRDPKSNVWQIGHVLCSGSSSRESSGRMENRGRIYVSSDSDLKYRSVFSSNVAYVVNLLCSTNKPINSILSRMAARNGEFGLNCADLHLCLVLDQRAHLGLCPSNRLLGGVCLDLHLSRHHPTNNISRISSIHNEYSTTAT